jgi:hypothetical protein
MDVCRRIGFLLPFMFAGIKKTPFRVMGRASKGQADEIIRQLPDHTPAF